MFSLQGIPGVPGKRGKMGRPVKFFLVYYADLVEWNWKQNIWLLAGSFPIFWWELNREIKQTFPRLFSQPGSKLKIQILFSSFLPCSAHFTGIFVLFHTVSMLPRILHFSDSLLQHLPLWPASSLNVLFNSPSWLQHPRCLCLLCYIYCSVLPSFITFASFRCDSLQPLYHPGLYNASALLYGNLFVLGGGTELKH